MSKQQPACSGLDTLTPQPTSNRPGLDKLAYRVGTHASFLESMLARLTTHKMVRQDRIGARLDSNSPLSDLRIRNSNDPSIAILDAWSSVADLLSFYQERLANEGFLRTATERRSLEELARLVGYQLKPGLSANTHLAFEIEQDTAPVNISKGTPATTIPGPGELPQTFETSDEVMARPEWNDIRAVVERYPNIRLSSARSIPGVTLRGTTTGLNAGDVLLFKFKEGTAVNRVIDEAQIDAEQGVTKIVFVPGSVSYERFEASIRPTTNTLRDDWIGFYDNETNQHLPDTCNRFPEDRPQILDSTDTLTIDSASTESLRTIHDQLNAILVKGRNNGLAYADEELATQLVEVIKFRGFLEPFVEPFAEVSNALDNHKNLLAGTIAQVQTQLQSSITKAINEIDLLRPELNNVAMAADNAAINVAFADLAAKLESGGGLETNATAQLFKPFVDAVANDPTIKQASCRTAMSLADQAKLELAGFSSESLPFVSTLLHSLELWILRSDAMNWPDSDKPEITPQLLSPIQVLTDGSPDIQAGSGSVATRALCRVPVGLARNLMGGANFPTQFGGVLAGGPRVTAVLEALDAEIALMRHHSSVTAGEWSAAITQLNAPGLAPGDTGLTLARKAAFSPFINIEMSGGIEVAVAKPELTAFPSLCLLIDPLVELAQLSDTTVVENAARDIAANARAVRTALDDFAAADAFDFETLLSTQESIQDRIGNLNVQTRNTDPQKETIEALQDAMRHFVSTIARVSGNRSLLGSFANSLATVLDGSKFAFPDLPAGLSQHMLTIFIGPLLKQQLSSLSTVSFSEAKRALEFAISLPTAVTATGQTFQSYHSNYTRLRDELDPERLGDSPSLYARIDAERVNLAKRARNELAENLARSPALAEIPEYVTFVENLEGISNEESRALHEIYKEVGQELDVIVEDKDPHIILIESLRNSDTPNALRAKTRFLPDIVAYYKSFGSPEIEPVITAQALRDSERGAAGLNAAIERLKDAFAPERIDGEGTSADPIEDLQVRLSSVLSSQSESVLFEAWRQQEPFPIDYEIFSFKDQLSLFGHNARDVLVPAEDGTTTCKPADKHPGGGSLMTLYLEREYSGILGGDHVIVETVDEDKEGSGQLQLRPHEVSNASNLSLDAYCMSGKTTRILLHENWARVSDPEGDAEEPEGEAEVVETEKPDFEKFIRKTTVRVGQVEQQIAPEPYPVPVGTALPQSDDSGLLEVSNTQIEFDRLIDGLSRDQLVIVAGTRAVSKTNTASAARVAHVEHIWRAWPGERPHTRVTFEQPLPFPLIRSTVRVAANVAQATHGETVSEEILGNGDAAQKFQRFSLGNHNVAHLPSTDGAVAQPELQVRVNDVLWDNRDNVLQLADDRAYIARVVNTSMMVEFGDGDTGQKLPTGIENVRAVYRTGIGKAGNVKGDQISQLPKPVLGVSTVRNPMPAIGGVDPEGVYLGRESTARYSSSLGRLISLRDYEDFSRNFGGVAKSVAINHYEQGRSVIGVSIALVDDAPAGQALKNNLRLALKRGSSEDVEVRVLDRQLAVLSLKALVNVDRRYRAADVVAEIDRRLRERYSFEKSNFGESIQRSEAVQLMQSVAGVDHVRIDEFGVVAKSLDDSARGRGDNHAGAPRTASDPDEGAGTAVEDKSSSSSLPILGNVGNRSEIALASYEIAYIPPSVAQAIRLTPEGGTP